MPSPELIVFRVAIVAGLRGRARPGGRVWIWTEWAGLAPGLLFAAGWWLDRLAAGDPGNPACAANVIVYGGWLGGIGLTCWLILQGRDDLGDRLTTAAHLRRS